MAISQTTHVREIHMVRPAIDAAWAFHQKKITITAGAGFPIPDIYGDAEPLNVDDLGGVLDAVFVDLVAERDAATAAKAEVEAAKAELEQMLSEKMAEHEAAISERMGERDGALAERDQARAQVLQLQAVATELGTQVAGLQLLLAGQPAPAG